MIIYLNHQAKEVPEAYSLSALLNEINAEPPFAVAINKTFVPKGLYADTVLQPEDHIDVVQPVVGG